MTQTLIILRKLFNYIGTEGSAHAATVTRHKCLVCEAEISGMEGH